MAGDIIEIRYDELAQVAARFEASSDAAQTILSRLNSGIEELQSGGWQSAQAQNLYNEYDEVQQAMNRLREALAHAASETRAISTIFEDAEAEAAALFAAGTSGPGYYSRLLDSILAVPNSLQAVAIGKLLGRVASGMHRLLRETTLRYGGRSALRHVFKLRKVLPSAIGGMVDYVYGAATGEHGWFDGQAATSTAISTGITAIPPVGAVDFGIQVIGGGAQYGLQVFDSLFGTNTQGAQAALEQGTEALSVSSNIDGIVQNSADISNTVGDLTANHSKADIYEAIDNSPKNPAIKFIAKSIIFFSD